jgi:hypothetical protein
MIVANGSVAECSFTFVEYSPPLLSVATMDGTASPSGAHLVHGSHFGRR